MPGYTIFVIITGLVTVLVLTAPRRPRFLVLLATYLAPSYNELPFQFLLLIAASVLPEYWQGRPLLRADWLGLALVTLVACGLVVIAVQGFRARAVLRSALDDGLGEGWRGAVAPRHLAGLEGGPRWWRVLFAPFLTARSNVVRVPDLSYGPAGRENRLDLYRPKAPTSGAPVLIYFHGGQYVGGSKRLGSAELLRRLASHCWVTISANYRLRPRAGFYDHLADAKRVIAWVREHGAEHGADGRTVFIAGGSAGGHLAAIAAQTQNEPRYQPGFEDADTSVTAAVGLYGWYGGYYELGGANSDGGPLGHAAGGAPPFLIAHGTLDTMATIETAERLVGHLRRGSRHPVVYAPLPGGHHGFDVFCSLRFQAVVDAVEAFAGWVLARTTEEAG